MRQTSYTRWEWGAVLLALFIAAALRLGWQGVNSFSFDEARVSHMALQMARAGDFAELGMQTSTGVPNFPALVWLISPAYALTTNPQLATNLIAAANVLAVIGVWWLARQWGGIWAGLAAAFLYAAAPYLVFYSRSIWGQNLLAPLAVLWAVAAYSALNHASQTRQAKLALALHAFLAGFIFQIHLGAIGLILASIWLGVVFRLWGRWQPIVSGAVVAFLCAFPAIYTIWRYGEGAQADLRRILAEPSQTSLKGFARLWDLATAQRWEGYWLNKDWVWPTTLTVLLNGAMWLLGLLIVVGIGVMVVRLGQTGQKKEPITLPNQPWHYLLPWAICAPLFFVRSKTSVLPQYLLVSLPALLILAGLVAGARPRLRWWGPLVASLCLGIALVQATAISRTLTLVGHSAVVGGMGTPLAYPQALAQSLADAGLPVVVETFGDAPEYDGDAAAFSVLLWDVPHQLVDARSVLLIPDQPANLLFTFDSLPAWSLAEQLNLTGSRQDFPRRLNEPPYVILPTNGFVSAGFSPVADGELANGAELVGWTTRPQGDNQIRLITYWHITGPIVPGHYQQFNHLYQRGDTTPTTVHDVYTSSHAWQEGDHLLTWADFELTDGPIAQFQVGMYTWPEQARVAVHNRAGDPLQPIQLEISK